MAQINLAPKSQYQIAARRRLRYLYFISFLFIVVIVVIWSALYILTNSVQAQLDEVNAKTKSVEAEIAKLNPEADRIGLFENRLKALDKLLDNHISWNPVLSELERLLPPETVLSSLKADMNNNSLTISGTTPSIDIIAQTLASLSQSDSASALFSSATIQNIRSDNKEVVSEDPEAEATFVSGYYFGAQLTFKDKSSN